MENKPGLKLNKNNIWVVGVSFFVLIIVCIAMWWKMQDIIDVQMEHQVAEQSKTIAEKELRIQELEALLENQKSKPN